ncbi:hypothetical protein PMKS-001553 [Pichia membranifaciens]|uniref:Uncharacterized protein n=1 Tax=Pichia membranifaciens TaxID=4926 RepID=A0A1Q2YF14_9ASCO|nr:hypothetical protein PMKS-001553 [Pichia membranifaciens]
MLGRYKFILKHRLPLSVPRYPTFQSPIYRRWNSSSGSASSIVQESKNNSDKEPKESAENELLETETETGIENVHSAEKIERHQNVKPEFLSFPWENAEKENHSVDEELPWASNTETEAEPILETDSADPSKSELILAPLRKKSSPIERLTPRKSVSHRADRSSGVNFQIERDYKNLMQFKYNVSSDDFINIIEELKPSTPVVTVKQLTELSLNLDKSFRRRGSGFEGRG